MTTFNKFADLPRELRDEIWRFAIREDRPGVHVFSHCDQSKAYTPASRVIVSRYGFRSTFSAPLPSRYFKSLKSDVPRKDVSTCLIDRGLWAACKESRLIMEKYFRQSEQIERLSLTNEEARSREQKMSKEEKLNICSTGFFWGTPFRHLTMFPHKDLFVLQADCFDDVDWENLGYDSGLGSSLLGFHGVHHIGVEFDPNWWNEEEGMWDYGIISTFNNAAYHVIGIVFTIWFIDHSLKRKKDAPAYKEISNDTYDLNAFYSGDRKFIEVSYGVDFNPEHWEFSEKEKYDAANYRQERTSVGFLRTLDEDVETDYDPEHVTNFCPSFCIGLLGWDDL